jgi:hypothetical protein
MRAGADASRILMREKAIDCTGPAWRGMAVLPMPVEGHAVMLDFAMIAAGVGFFAVAVLYVLACEKM